MLVKKSWQLHCCSKTIHQTHKEAVYKNTNPSPDAEKDKQGTKTTSQRSGELAKQNERVKEFLGQPQNKPSDPNLQSY